MPSVKITLPHHEYEVQIEPDLLARLGQCVNQVAPHHRAGLVLDRQIAGHWGAMARQALTKAGYELVTHSMDSSEQCKTLETVREIYGTLLEAHLERRSPIVAMGGGIVGDTAGFAAATYLRGVPLVQCPTTLLAMVDASVGGKVAVNMPQGKNLIGSFYQPHLVVIDTSTLATLPDRQLRMGLAECVKHGMIADPDLFYWIEQNLESIKRRQPDALVELVSRNVQIKAQVVMRDEKETGLRAQLNFGHTFAHAIETRCPAYQHGEAVGLGMIAATRLATADGSCDADVLRCLEGLLQRIGLPTRAGDLPETSKLVDTMRHDKKVADGRIRLVLPERLGRVRIVADCDIRAVERAWQQLRSGS